VQAFRQEKRLTDEFERINGEHLDYANRSVDVNSLFLRPAMTLLQVLAYAVILTFFGLNWQSSGFTAGGFFVLEKGVFMIVWTKTNRKGDAHESESLLYKSTE